MKIAVTSLLVNNQENALQFYTRQLGFVKKNDIPVGEYKWLTVVSPEEPEGIELLLEPTAFTPSQLYQKALFNAGIPAFSFAVKNIMEEEDRLLESGVEFTLPPTSMGEVTVAVINDTCGNLIQLVQHTAIDYPDPEEETAFTS